MSQTVFFGARVVTPSEIIDEGMVVCDGPFIADVQPMRGTVRARGDATLVEARGLTLMPGFLDVHIHGGGGGDTMDATPDALRAICETHAAHGTTGLLLTTMTQSREAITTALQTARDAWQAGPEFCMGAQVLGVHVEGPYISPKRPGAQPAQFVRDYDASEFSEWLSVAGGAIKWITVAPEMPGADALIDACRAARIVVSMGHTDADSAQTKDALARGVSHATHLFNAMPSIHHRNPGPIPVLLLDPNANVEIIADGHHVAPEVIAMVLKAKGPERVVLITDGIAGAGVGDGNYELGGNPVSVVNGKATLVDGTLAGSVLTMNQAAQNVRDWTGADWSALARMTATNVAEELGWPKRGRIAPDCHADLVLVDDALTVRATYVAGRRVYGG